VTGPLDSLQVVAEGGDVCIHGIAPATCATCKTPGITVIISDGGSCYHGRSSCQWLHHGQDAVRRRGGQVGNVRSVPLTEAKRLGRCPCDSCLGGVEPKASPSVGRPKEEGLFHRVYRLDAGARCGDCNWVARPYLRGSSLDQAIQEHVRPRRDRKGG
jgi:hypothetical protein